jgi:hypothetical protein
LEATTVRARRTLSLLTSTLASRKLLLSDSSRLVNNQAEYKRLIEA